MWRNYIKIALRGFAKQKLTFFINLFGLALGLWAAILIGLWVKSELAMDRHFADIDQVYRMMEHQNQGQEILTTTMTPGILARELKEVSPEVEFAACFTWMEDLLFVNRDKRIKLEGIYAEPDYLHILQHGILHGDRRRLLTEKSHLVLTQEAAMRLFGRTDVVGETIEINGLGNENPFVVQAVLETIPTTSSFQFDFILPFQIMLNIPGRQWLDGWATNGPNTIVKLHKEVDGQAFSEGIENFIKERSEGNNVRLFAYPQKDLYLYGEFQDGVQVGGRIEHVKLFSVIGLFVLLIACINFMNLSTAKSQQRAKEVGIRKVVGAGNGSLVRQWGEERVITGVVEDFHFQSFHQNMEPAIMILNPDTGPSCFVRIGAGDIQNAIASIRSLAEEINPDFPFEYSFMDENYARLYREDLKVRDLAGYFSILTILISCLGLLGLSSHIADQKIKEIGIRKVLGASTFAILHVINREFVVIVTASIVIGSGLAYWLMQEWLAGYAYRIDFEWWFIPLAASVILSTAYLTVTLQALKAAGVNPVESLRSE